MAQKALSTYQIADLCKVHHTTVINWIKDGMLPGYTTPGGHRRVLQDELKDFMQRYKIPMPEQMHRDKNYRVLIVDDDIEFLEELREALSGDGYIIDCALNGFEAGRKIFQKKPDMILLDFKMPGIDGFQVCQILKQDKDMRAIPVIAVTSMTSADEVERIKKSGVRRYFPKPLNVIKLKKFLQTTLKQDHEFQDTEIAAR